MKASKEQIMRAFEEDTKALPGFDLDYTRTASGEGFESLLTTSVYGPYAMGWQGREERDMNNAWLKTRGHR